MGGDRRVERLLLQRLGVCEQDKTQIFNFLYYNIVLVKFRLLDAGNDGMGEIILWHEVELYHVLTFTEELHNLLSTKPFTH